jgi:hypothetical protein
LALAKDKEQRDFRIFAGSNGSQATSLDFNKIRVGKNTLQNDVTINPYYYTDKDTRPIKKKDVERAIQYHELDKMRAISDFYFDKSGIYSRLCRYVAFLYKYDLFTVPIIYDDKIKDEKIVEGWFKSCDLLENCNLKRTFGKIALRVVKNGCYYGYKIVQKNAVYLQELPVKYCRSRYELNGKPAVEFNMKYFDDAFKDAQYRMRVLKMFPKEIQKGYVAYKNGNLPKDYQGDTNGWLLLDTKMVVKFNLNGSDAPLFISVIPAIIDLEEAQDLDKEKMRQQLLKIIVQKMPIDKNGDLIFDVDEANALHKNAVAMLGKSIGVDVLTTFAEVDSIDLSDKGNVSSVDQLDKVERTVFNSAGVSQMQFNTDGNIALEKSIANDEAMMSDLLLQFEEYAQSLLAPFNKNPKRLRYKVQMLPTTIYNYKEISSLYKEHTMLGYSKLLPQVALGQAQTTIIASAYFENELMNLDELFVAPQMSSTMSSKDKDSGSDSNKTSLPSQDKGGRPPKADGEKSEKTIQNIESGG